ncbi:hypothetical protein TrLO_g5244 [Triparma laevis f. longispina]|uniref:Uncharacterized protein n=1 Tax=Triparma laevis f. longispina TaxID=1714387 RepID=A0A9W7A322_9STRA|nr:hypothetical protein TrLO_g5244 [Triparma laevis f. longispina]
MPPKAVPPPALTVGTIASRSLAEKLQSAPSAAVLLSSLPAASSLSTLLTGYDLPETSSMLEFIGLLNCKTLKVHELTSEALKKQLTSSIEQSSDVKTMTFLLQKSFPYRNMSQNLLRIFLTVLNRLYDLNKVPDPIYGALVKDTTIRPRLDRHIRLELLLRFPTYATEILTPLKSLSKPSELYTRLSDILMSTGEDKSLSRSTYLILNHLIDGTWKAICSRSLVRKIINTVVAPHSAAKWSGSIVTRGTVNRVFKALRDYDGKGGSETAWSIVKPYTGAIASTFTTCPSASLRKLLSTMKSLDKLKTFQSDPSKVVKDYATVIGRQNIKWYDIVRTEKLEDFESDMLKVYDNCIKYNVKGPYVEFAIEQKMIFEVKLEKVKNSLMATTPDSETLKEQTYVLNCSRYYLSNFLTTYALSAWSSIENLMQTVTKSTRNEVDYEFKEMHLLNFILSGEAEINYNLQKEFNEEICKIVLYGLTLKNVLCGSMRSLGLKGIGELNLKEEVLRNNKESVECWLTLMILDMTKDVASVSVWSGIISQIRSVIGSFSWSNFSERILVNGESTKYGLINGPSLRDSQSRKIIDEIYNCKRETGFNVLAKRVKKGNGVLAYKEKLEEVRRLCKGGECSEKEKECLRFVAGKVEKKGREWIKKECGEFVKGIL